MPVGFSSAARNLFLLGSTGGDVVTNFFKAIDKSAGTDEVYLPDEIKYNALDEKYLLAGSAQDNTAKGFGWFEKRGTNGTADWDVRVEATTSVNTTLRAMELDANDNLIVVGKTGSIPWIARYTNGGVIDWQSTTNTGDVEYTGITSDSSGNYYACGSTPIAGTATAFVEKFDGTGTPGWGKSAFMLGRDVVLNKVAVNNRGEVVAVGYLEDDSATKGYIVKIDTTTGDVLWDRTINDTADYFGNNPVLNLTDVYIDSMDQIYVVGSVSRSSAKQILIKYTAEGNIIWQTQTGNNILSTGADIIPVNVKSDGETEQTIVASTYSAFGFGGLLLSKYDKQGSLVFRRMISSSLLTNVLQKANLDADPSFYYVLFTDQGTSQVNGTPNRYTFGKVSTSGNGLGNFQYPDGSGEIIDYEISNVTEKIGRLSDGSVRQDSSDLITYPFSANKLLFDDLATQVANKKRQMDGPDSFEYSGSPAIRPADFQELNLLGDVYSGSGNWLDQSGKGNDGVVNGATWNASGWWEFDGINDYIIGNTPSGLDLSQSCSVDVWVYFNSFSPVNPRIIEIQDSNNSVQIIVDGATASLATKNTSFQTGTDSTKWTSPALNTWYNIVVIWNPSTLSTTLYVNNNLEPSTGTTSVGPGNQPGKYILGVRSDFNSTTWINGRIGEVRIYPRALTAAQVFQNYNATREKYTGLAASTDPGLTSTRTPA